MPPSAFVVASLAMADPITDDHRRIRGELDRRVRAALERGTRNDLDGLVALVEGELLGHARAEQQHLYPAVDALVRDHGRATATMEIDHEAIAGHVRTISVSVERLRAAKDRATRMEARAALREALLRLDAVLSVHLDKEERVYLPLIARHMSAAEQEALSARLHGAEPAPSADTTIDAREIPQRERHGRIFDAFDRLPLGASLVVVNDHDPRPLSYQFETKRPGAYRWDYLERGPVWRVRITRGHAAK